MQNHVGTMSALWRYPIKSMQGEQIDASQISERGILGDRAYAILDCATGYIASAKHPRKWQALLACRAQFVAQPQPGDRLPPVAITLPDGNQIASTDTDVDRVLSRVLGREVRLIADAPPQPLREANRTPLDAPGEVIKAEAMARAAPAGTFFDYATLHLLTTATLDYLQSLHPAGDFAVPRFRANIVITPIAPLGAVEHGWLGHTLRLGAATLYALDPSPRCVVTTLAQAGLPHDPLILRTIATHSAVASITAAPGVVLPAVAGIYARVQQPGLIQCGDQVIIED